MRGKRGRKTGELMSLFEEGCYQLVHSTDMRILERLLRLPLQISRQICVVEKFQSAPTALLRDKNPWYHDELGPIVVQNKQVITHMGHLAPLKHSLTLVIQDVAHMAELSSDLTHGAAELVEIRDDKSGHVCASTVADVESLEAKLICQNIGKRIKGR